MLLQNHFTSRFARAGVPALLVGLCCSTFTSAVAGDREREGRRDRDEGYERAGHRVPSGDREPLPDHVQRALGEKAEHLKRALHELEGRDDPEADRKREGIQQALRKIHGEMERLERRPERPADLERRLHHMRQAAENLAAAGMEDQAQRIMRQAEEMAQRVQQAARDREPGNPNRELMRHVEELTRMVRDLREEFRDLRDEMDDIREELESLEDEDEEDDDEDDDEEDDDEDEEDDD